MKKKHTAVKTIPIIIILTLLTIQTGLANEFYLNLLKDCQKEYLRQNYQKVLSNLDIARFGLKEDRENLKTTYLYYIATYFKLRQLDKAREYHEILKREFDLAGLTPKDHPDDIRADLVIADIFIRKGIKNPGNWRVKIEYEDLFYNSLMDIEDINDSQLKKTCQRMKTIDKKDPRREAFFAIIEFRKNNFPKVIKVLERILKSPDISLTEVTDRLNYYLALSYYHIKENQTALDIIKKISSQTIIARIQELMNINKVNNKKQ